MGNRKIVRSNGAGVFFGEIVKKDGNTVTIKNARRLWYWEGASSLSELAQYGTASPSSLDKRFAGAIPLLQSKGIEN